MKKNTRLGLKSSLATLTIGVLSVFNTSTLYAVDDMSIRSGVKAAHGANQPTDLFGTYGIFTTITNTLLFIVGALSVVMIIVGGLRYVVSGGSSAVVTGGVGGTNV